MVSKSDVNNLSERRVEEEPFAKYLGSALVSTLPGTFIYVEAMLSIPRLSSPHTIPVFPRPSIDLIHSSVESSSKLALIK